MDLQLPSEDVQKLVQAAILQSLTPERREAMFVEALKSLFEPRQSNGIYGTNRCSTIQEAFNDAAVRTCRDMFYEELKKPETQVLLSGMVGKALAKALDQHEVAEGFAQVLVRTFGKIERD